MHYSYGNRRSHYAELKESTNIANQRIKYIKKVKQYHKEGRQIFYQDETWITKNMTASKVWLDENGKGGLKVPPGKGKWSIVSHVGSASGFVNGAKLIFRGKKALKDSNYHTEMNAEVFLHWLRHSVFPSLPNNSVLVIDRATYHYQKQDQHCLHFVNMNLRSG